MVIKMIVAVGPDNLIGCGDKLCWHLPDELKFFKEMTLNSTLFMGQTTYSGLPKKLPNRTFAVLGYEKPTDADIYLDSLDAAAKFLKDKELKDETVWIAGGKFIYENFYQFAQEIYVSEVETEVKGDVHLNLDLKNYKKEFYRQGEGFKTYVYRKAQND